MKVLILGINGMLGHKLFQVFGNRFETFGTCRGKAHNYFSGFPSRGSLIFENVDVKDEQKVRAVIEDVRPDVVVNAIGIIKQIPTSRDIVTTLSVNSIFPHRLESLCDDLGIKVITFSTDCVFKGDKGNYSETDIPDALDLYGQSKHWGELDSKRHLTVRSSIIGHELGHPHSLVDWFLSNRGGKVKGFKNAIYTGFPTIIFADIIGNLVESPEISGIVHISSDPISKFDLLEIINQEYDAGITIEPDEEFKIDRSLDSTRFRETNEFAPEPWPDMIATMHSDSGVYKKIGHS
ncbi:dTDP-4-dehydrorhamnose reductase family protein [Leptolyngbya sp. 7M]|uniref:dTDP-4-dehydrorhamnose reductase family protein n=1 Tax=Leptolyngbya sp. 7M TaxID=2812896 RepID=UPI001B8BD900|nr:SDR family oxidoreductase [Leptolyngbya sp. 7M]QYO66184.1 SDR family oxidoreductase [Leptolyngbya sp. 7M]